MGREEVRESDCLSCEVLRICPGIFNFYVYIGNVRYVWISMMSPSLEKSMKLLWLSKV